MKVIDNLTHLQNETNLFASQLSYSNMNKINKKSFILIFFFFKAKK